MKRILVFFVLLALLAGCANEPAEWFGISKTRSDSELRK
jgi:hypothetical protein